MDLFQPSVQKNYLKLQDKEAVAKAYKKYTKYFHNATIQQNIRESKEEQFQQKFLMELFVNVFDYVIFPDSNHNLTTEFKNEKGAQKADGAILKDGKAIAVIELKGTKTKDLEKIRKQAFDYKANQSECVYIITSNFEKLRFYINDAVNHEEFNLFNLTEERFELLYLCLHKDSILNNLPLKIKQESIVEEESITKSFYANYSLFKRELYRDLVKENMKNDVFRTELQKEDSENANKNIKRTLFKKSQKLIDRFLFIFFAEDRGLLPPNSTLQILQKWKKDIDFGDERPLYVMFKQYFHFLDIGRQGTTSRAEIFAYNGGLFKPDSTLDSLIIDDQLLYKHSKALSDYNFESQIDVNILGHIFENSLNEIESINAEIDGISFDKQTTKRKKDGVFYTPKYITKYIVDNTVGKLCSEKKIKLDIEEEEYYKSRKGRTTKKLQELKQKLDDYRYWLLTLTILDPACGSGAFLNQALDFLINEHRYIDELKANLLGVPMVLSDIENTVLEKNIFGVDVNEESVEIAKLSLWLRTAQPRRKLNILTNNIKCGNSLIDTKSVAGEKAFNWQLEFPEVFVKGGFDVVIGNPPYVRVQGLKEHYFEHTVYYEKKYRAATGNYDIYALFMEKSYELLNKQGHVSFILPHKFLISDFGIGIREHFVENNSVNEIIHFGANLVFQDATTYTCIINLSKTNKEKIKFKQINPSELFNESSFNELNYSKLTSEQWILSDSKISKVLDKISKQPIQLKDTFNRFVQGIITGKDIVYCVKGKVENNYLIVNDENGNKHFLENEILKPHLRGEDVNKYRFLENKEWLIFPYVLINGKAELLSQEILQTKYPNTWNYLKVYETILRNRENGKFDNDSWYQYSRNQAISVLEQPKIITPEVCFGGSMTLDENNYYHNSKCHTLLLNNESNYTYKSILPILNSSLFWFYLSNTGNVLRGGYIGVKRKVLEPFSIPKSINDSTKEFFENKTELILSINSKFATLKRKFLHLLSDNFEIGKTSKKLESFYNFDFKVFLKELNKQKVKLSLTEQAEWKEFFEQYKQEINQLQSEILCSNKEIDQIVYELYGLTEEEIKIVETDN